MLSKPHMVVSLQESTKWGVVRWQGRLSRQLSLSPNRLQRTPQFLIHRT